MSKVQKEYDRLKSKLQEARAELEVERQELMAAHQTLNQAQRQTEETRKGYAELYDFALVGLVTFDEQGCIRRVNAACANLLGLPAAHLIGRPILPLIAQSDRRRWFPFLRSVINNEGQVRTEFAFCRPGQPEPPRIIETTAIMVRKVVGGGNFLRAVLWDVTVQRRAEEAAREAQAELKFVADNAPVILARCSAELRYLFVNDACARLLKLPRERIVGRRISEVIGKKAFSVIWPYVERALQGEMVEYELEVPYQRAGRRFMHVVYRPERDDAGRVTGWLAAITDITERKRVELALRESETRFRHMADSAPVLIWISDAKRQRVYFNKPWLNFTGRTLEQELGRGWSELVHPDDRQPCLKAHAKAFERQEELRLEYRLRRHDGRYRWVLDHGIPRFSGRQFQGYIGSCVDITDRREAEDAVREARDILEQRVAERTAELQAEVMIRRHAERVSARLAAIVESSADAIASYNLDGKIMSWNKGAERLYGYSLSEIVGQPVARLYLPKEARAVRHTLDSIRRGGMLEPFEMLQLDKEGRHLDVFLQLSPVKDESGAVVGVSHVARDIGARKQAEEALRESEARLQSITDHCPAMIYLKDPEGRYLHFNRRFEEVFGVRLAQMLGRTDGDIFPARMAAVIRARELKVLKARLPMIFDEIMEQKGGVHANLVTRFPLLDAHGRVYALGGVVTDVTERRRLEEEILRISEREQRRIAQDLHDGLGQQLAGICFMGDALRKSLTSVGSPDSAKATAISRLLHATVSQTRGLARGLHPVEEESQGLMSALRSLAESMVEMYRVRCWLRCARPVLVQNNQAATHLFRIAQEAVNNAVRHGQARRIEIMLSSNAKTIMLAIRDDGRGISAPKAHPEGMGLRIMDYRAQMIGGNVRVDPRRSGGTEVVCTVARENLEQ